jgi:hypothetical protein
MSDDVVRTSLVLPKILDRNLQAYCAIESKSKTEVIIELVKQKLNQEGYKPDQLPRMVNY